MRIPKVGRPALLSRDVLLSHRVCKQPSIYTAFRVMEHRVLWCRVLLHRTRPEALILRTLHVELSIGLAASCRNIAGVPQFCNYFNR